MGQHASGLDWQWFFPRQKDAGNGKKLKEMNKMNKKWKEMKKRKRNEKREKKWKKWTKNENKWKQRKKKQCMCFLFLLVFSFFSSWVSRQWDNDNLHLVFNWEIVSWDHFFLFVFSVFFFFCYSLTKKCKTIEISEKNMFFLKRKTKEIANVLQGCFWCNVLWKNLRLFARGQRCQNKSQFWRGHSLNRLNRMK